MESSGAELRSRENARDSCCTLHIIKINRNTMNALQIDSITFWKIPGAEATPNEQASVLKQSSLSVNDHILLGLAVSTDRHAANPTWRTTFPWQEDLQSLELGSDQASISMKSPQSRMDFLSGFHSATIGAAQSA